jgi:hypothetical protein
VEDEKADNDKEKKTVKKSTPKIKQSTKEEAEKIRLRQQRATLSPIAPQVTGILAAQEC